eukprot:6492381-Amphidinium_carterae.3
MRELFRVGTERLAQAMDEAISVADAGRSVKFILPPSTDGRRMRVDEDLKRNLIEDESRKKRA